LVASTTCWRLPAGAFPTIVSDSRRHVRRVDEIDTRVERSMDDGVDGRLIQAADNLPHLSAAAKGHRAEAEFGDEDASVSKRAVFHRWT
jgi:hypothetical protein